MLRLYKNTILHQAFNAIPWIFSYLSPVSPKNPIKREKKKLVCSSEREDFIKSGEDQFVRFLRAFLKGLLFVFLYNYAVRLLYGKSEDGYGFYCLLK